MTRKELARETSLRTGYTAVVCDEIIREVFDVIFDVMVSYEPVKVQSFGTFCVYDKKPRNIYNPETKEVVMVDGCKYPKFIPSEQLKEAIRQ